MIVLVELYKCSFLENNATVREVCNMHRRIVYGSSHRHITRKYNQYKYTRKPVKLNFQEESEKGRSNIELRKP